MEDIKRVISFDSVEEFWGYAQTAFGAGTLISRRYRLYNNIVPPSTLPQKANYYLFKVRTALCEECVMLKPRFAHVGGYHPCMGGRGEQKRWQVEYPAA